MNTKLIVLAAALCAAACTRMENPREERIPVSLTYTTVQATETKAAQDLNEGDLAVGTEVAVRIRNTGSGNNWTQYIFTVDADGTLVPSGEPPYYPDGDGRIDIVAYCPASVITSVAITATGMIPCSVPTDQTSDDAYKAADVMFASVRNQGRTPAPINLAFTHLMSKLNVNITPGAGVGSINSVSILNVIREGQLTVDMGDVRTKTSASATSITMSNDGAACFPAQTISGNLLSIETDMGTATYSVPAGKTFEAGKQYTFNLTVNLREVGLTNVITDWTENGEVTVNPYPGVYKDYAPAGAEAIDLGLSVKWANMNVGAMAETDYGTYFAWGETAGYTVIGATTTPVEGNYKDVYNWYTYKWCNGDLTNGTITSITKYCDKSEFWDDRINNDTPDYKYQLELDDDAAHVNWGGSWRMPTFSEMTELMQTEGKSGYTWTWCDGSTTQYKGSTVKGWKVVYLATGATLFLPAANMRKGAYFTSTDDSFYWTSSLAGTWVGFGPVASFADISFFYVDGAERCYGIPVRAVQP